MTDSDLETIDDTPSETKEDRIRSAIEIKAQGNDAFKNKDFESAKRLYKDAIAKLGSVSPDLESALHNNASAAYLATGEYFEAIKHATKALEIDPNNEKAIFRRAQANLLCGYPDEAKADAIALLKINPNSKDAAFKGIFDKTAGMYEQAERAARESAMSNPKSPPVSTPLHSPPDSPKLSSAHPQSPPQKARPFPPKVPPPSENLREEKEEGSPPLSEEDDEDVKIINETKKMGYCYFQNHAKKAEQHLKSFKSKTISSPNPGAPAPVSSENRAISSWNSKGTTYEEKSMSKWALSAFEKHIRETPSAINEPGVEFVVLDVRDLEGDATISVIRSSKRYMFDFTCTIDLRLTYNEKEEYEINLKLQDISSELVSGDSWKDGMKYSLEGVATEKIKYSMELFKDSLCTSINNFFETFKRLD